MSEYLYLRLLKLNAHKVQKLNVLFQKISYFQCAHQRVFVLKVSKIKRTLCTFSKNQLISITLKYKPNFETKNHKSKKYQLS